MHELAEVTTRTTSHVHKARYAVLCETIYAVLRETRYAVLRDMIGDS